MHWIRTDVFCFRQRMPQYVEEEHLMVMGHRSDNRVYYAVIAIPDNSEERKVAYKELKETFNEYLKEKGNSMCYTTTEYGLMVEGTIRKCKGFVLDTFPDGV
jgi:hypothetical protein